MIRSLAVIVAVFVLLGLFACKREERRFREPTPSSTASGGVNMSGLHPAVPNQGQTQTSSPVNNAYEQSAYAVAQGQKLFDQYNCTGCHAHGGGGIGPPLMDEKWIYGSQPQNVYMTIIEGRPNGMPSFGGKIPDQQVWQLVAYVRSLSGQLRLDIKPGRSDHMYGAKPPANTKKLTPLGPEGTPDK